MAAQPSPTALSDVVEIDQAAQPLLDEEARPIVHRLGEWVRAHAAGYGLRLDSIRARRWQSAEDPDWVMVIVEPTVVGESEKVMHFWEAASDRLDALIEARPAAASALLDLLTVHVHWVDPRWR